MNCINDFCNHKQAGAAIVLFAIFIGIILAFLALGIDIFILSISKSQHHTSTEMASLAALEEYLDSQSKGLSNADSLKHAANRAGDIINSNRDAWLGSAYFEDDTDLQNDIGTPTSPGVNGILIPGIWHFADPDCATYTGGTATCPCSGAGNTWNNKPCFEQIGETQSANAFQLDLNLSSTSLIGTIFGRTFGAAATGLKSSAIASQIPRRGVFLIDLSRSTVADTHERSFSTGGGDPEYEFSLLPQAGSCSTFANPGDSSTWSISDFDSGDQQAWAYILNTMGLRPGATPPTQHYYDDYMCFSGQDFPGTEFDVPDYVIDTKSNPQPLQSILAGIYSAIEKLETRSVIGDKIAVLAFDDEILKSRGSLNAAKTDLGLFSPQPGNPVLNDFKTATAPPASGAYFGSTLINRLDTDGNGGMDLFLFPRTESNNSNYSEQIFIDYNLDNVAQASEYWSTFPRPTRPHTDIPLGLKKAGDILSSEPGFRQAENFVILFSDGLTNCSNSVSAAGSYTTTSGGLVLLHKQRSRCWGDQSHFDSSMTNLASVINNYVNNNISFSTIITGNVVAPHTLLRKGNNGKCMDDHSARAGSLTFTDWIHNNSGGISTYSDPVFYGPNQLWQYVQATNGFWIPIRPRCDGRADTNATSTNIIGELDTACAGFGGSIGSLVPSSQFGGLSVIGSNGITLGSIIDSNSRLTCDPLSRSASDQVQDAIAAIMARNPYLLVK